MVNANEALLLGCSDALLAEGYEVVIARNGFESAFLPFEERKRLIARVRDEIAALRAPADAHARERTP